MVVTIDPFGYVFFVEKHPVAFKTDHNPLWDELVKKSCVGKGCEWENTSKITKIIDGSVLMIF